MIFYMLTSLTDQSTRVLCAGQGAQELVRRAFEVPAGDGPVLLRGVVSRKKQFIPQLLQAIQAG